MRQYSYITAAGLEKTVTCERLEISDNRVAFVGPEGNYISLHNDEVRILRREL